MTLPQDDPATRRRSNWVVLSVGAGILAGLLSGLFGVGGGIIMVPALVYLVGMDQRRAHGTSLAAVIPIAVSSGLSYAVAGKIDWRVALILAAGSMVGAWFGTMLLQRVEQRLLGGVFVALMLLTAVRLLMADNGSHSQRNLTLVVGAAVLLGGAFAGIMAGLLGVGGGSVLVPIMIVGLGMPTVTAKGTSLAVIVLSATVGTLGNRRNSNVDVRVAMTVGLSGVAAAFLGGMISLDLPQRLADGLFAALLSVVAAKMLWDITTHSSVP